MAKSMSLHPNRSVPLVLACIFWNIKEVKIAKDKVHNSMVWALYKNQSLITSKVQSSQEICPKVVKCIHDRNLMGMMSYMWETILQAWAWTATHFITLIYKRFAQTNLVGKKLLCMWSLIPSNFFFNVLRLCRTNKLQTFNNSFWAARALASNVGSHKIVVSTNSEVTI